MLTDAVSMGCSLDNHEKGGIEWQKRTHPHADAIYRVITKNGAFAVEVSIPETYPATVSPFPTEADAEAWIAEHRRRVQSENKPNRWFRGAADHRDRPGSPAGDDA